MTHHSTTQYHAVLELFGSDATTYMTLAVVARIFTRLRITTKIRMTLRTKPIKRASHIHFLLCRHIEERQVER